MLLQDITLYIDGNGLVSPSVVPAGVIRASDNGPLFTSILLILASLNGEKTDSRYLAAIEKCVDSEDHLHRAPGDMTRDTPDDYIGVSSLSCYEKEGIVKLSLPLAICQPVIVYMWLMARKIPLWLILSPLAALIIALSNIGEDKSSTSDKLETWTIIKGVSERSLLCRLAGKIWTWRMKKIYGSTDGIPSLYFGNTHPFVKYWVE